MHQPTADLLNGFYQAFQRKDAEAMAACYATDVTFGDPVFPDLKGAEAGDMWRMLCGRAPDLEVKATVLDATPDSGSVHWDAWYTFSATGRKVHNSIDAHFKLKDGKIVEHRDSFDLWRWTRQALGPVGLLLGWSPVVRNKVRAQAAAGLQAFRAKRGPGSPVAR